jgi:hypothetical protein
LRRLVVFNNDPPDFANVLRKEDVDKVERVLYNDACGMV